MIGAGQEDYDRLRPLSYPDSNVVLICFAIDNSESLASVERKWVYELEQYCAHVPWILVGCKSDLRDDTTTAKDLGFTLTAKAVTIYFYFFALMFRDKLQQRG